MTLLATTESAQPKKTTDAGNSARIVEFIKERRRDLGWMRATEFFEEMQRQGATITLGHYYKVESGERSFTTVNKATQDAIRKALNLTVDQWLTLTGLASPSPIQGAQVVEVKNYASARELFSNHPPSQKIELLGRYARRIQEVFNVELDNVFAFNVEHTLYVAADTPVMRGQTLYVVDKLITDAMDVYLYRCPELQTILLAGVPEETKILHKNERLEIVRLEPSYKKMILPPDYTLEFVGSTIAAFTTSW